MVFGYGAGAAIALLARRPLARTNDPIHTRYFATTALWSAAVFAPTGIVLYAGYPDWMLMYLANPAHLPGLLMYPILLLLYAGAPLTGFLATHRLLLADKAMGLRAELGVIAALLALITVFGRNRLVTVAYYDAYHTGVDTVSLFRSALLLALLPCSVAICGILAFVLVTVKKHADLEEHVPGERRAPSSTRIAADSETSQIPSTDPSLPANLPRPPQGATPGN